MLRIVVTAVLAVSAMAPVLAVGARTAHASTDYRLTVESGPELSGLQPVRRSRKIRLRLLPR